MAEETSFVLPKIPQLLGEENLEEWKAAIHNHFEWYDILNHLRTDIPQPQDPQAQKSWRQARLKGKITIHSSFNNKTVRDKLKNAGWNPLNDTNPRDIYDLILRVIPSTSEEALSALYIEFCNIDRATAWLLLKGPNAPAKGNKTAPRAIKGRYLGRARRGLLGIKK